jgi:plasmid stabilization system protein ParE
MSSPNYPLVVSDQAQTDYEDILSVTLRTWGEQQYDHYAALLNDAFWRLIHRAIP